MNKTFKTLVFWAVIVVSAFLLWQIVRAGNAQATNEISYSQFLAQVADGQVSKVIINGSSVRGYNARGNAAFRVVSPTNQTTMLEALERHGVEIWFRDVSGTSPLYWILNCGPNFILIVVCIMLVRQMHRTNRILASGSAQTSTGGTQPRVGP